MTRKRSRIGPIVCILGGALLLAPMVYACIFPNAGFWGSPKGGSGGSNVPVWIRMEVDIENDHNIMIEATIDPGQIRFIGSHNVNASWHVIWSNNPGPQSFNIDPGRTRTVNIGPLVPLPLPRLDSGNQYCWNWDKIRFSASCGRSFSWVAGKSGWYYCK